MFVPALSLIAFGGPGVQNSVMHLSNLFPGSKATTTALITGSFQISFFIFFIFDQLWYFFGINYQTLFFSYGCISASNIVISLLLWPDEPYHFSFEEEELTVLNVEEGYGSMNVIVKPLAIHHVSIQIGDLDMYIYLDKF